MLLFNVLVALAGLTSTLAAPVPVPNAAHALAARQGQGGNWGPKPGEYDDGSWSPDKYDNGGWSGGGTGQGHKSTQETAKQAGQEQQEEGGWQDGGHQNGGQQDGDQQNGGQQEGSAQAAAPARNVEAKAKAALDKAAALVEANPKTWEVATLHQAEAELAGQSVFTWSGKEPRTRGAALAEQMVFPDPEGVLVPAEKDSQADVFSLIPATRAFGQPEWASNMLNWLQQSGLRVNGEGFSHRFDGPAFWSDEGYMIPPVLAYMGLVEKKNDLIGEALTQWGLIADGLKNGQNTFTHIGDGKDPNAWTTGTGWMLMGLARVLATAKAAGQDAALQGQITPLLATAKAALEGAFSKQTDDGRLPNYTDKQSPPETAGTAAVTAGYYRLAALYPDQIRDGKLDAAAEKAFNGVMAQTADDGTVSGTVDPSGADFDNANTDNSPEGHSFVPLLWVARKEFGGK